MQLGRRLVDRLWRLSGQIMRRLGVSDGEGALFARGGLGDPLAGLGAHFGFRPTRAAVTAAAALAVGLVLVLAVRARLFLEQRLPVGDRDLIIVGVDFGEGEKTVAIAAVVDEGGLERGLHAGHLGEIDIAA